MKYFFLNLIKYSIGLPILFWYSLLLVIIALKEIAIGSIDLMEISIDTLLEIWEPIK